MNKSRCILNRSRSIIALTILLSSLLSENSIAQKMDISCLTELLAQSTLGPWKTARSSHGILLKYRTISYKDGFSTRQLMAEFTLESNLKPILQHLKEPQLLQEWNEGFRTCRVLFDSTESWVTHAIYKIPFPFAQQDLVSRYQITHEDHQVIVNAKSSPDILSPIEGFKREEFNFSQWILIPQRNGQVKVYFSVVTSSNNAIPQAIKDPIIQRKLIRSFRNLQKLVE